MAELLGAVQDTPIPNLLVLAGIVFIFLAIAGGLTDKVTVPKERQRLIGGIGAVLLVTGIGLHVLDSQRSPSGDAEATPAPTQPAIVTASTATQATATSAAVVPESTQACVRRPHRPLLSPPQYRFPRQLALARRFPAPRPSRSLNSPPAYRGCRLNSNAIPGSYFYLFNVSTPPFDDVRLRKAFVLALDRQALSTLANSLSNQTRPATTFTPPETLVAICTARLDCPSIQPPPPHCWSRPAIPTARTFRPSSSCSLLMPPMRRSPRRRPVSMWRANRVWTGGEILDLEDDVFFDG